MATDWLRQDPGPTPVSATLGPVVGGGLVVLAGWPVIFLVNVPGLILSKAWLPVDAAPLKVPSGVQPARTGSLAVSGRLVAIYAQFAAVNFVFYSAFFGLPLWLEGVRGYSPDTTGLLLLPVAGVGVLATPVATRLISRVGPQPAIATGSLLLVTGSLLLFPVDSSTSVPVLLVIGAVLGVPNGFTNLGCRRRCIRPRRPSRWAVPVALSRPPQPPRAWRKIVEQSATPKVLLRLNRFLSPACRYAGAVLATTLIGVLFGTSATDETLHIMAAVISMVIVGLVVASVRYCRQ